MSNSIKTNGDGEPFQLHNEIVRPEWLDYNGHMNVAFYVLAFDHATDAMFDHLGVGTNYRSESGHSLFVLESHVVYEREVAEGTPLAFATWLLDADAKRLHFCHEMYHAVEGWRAATNELLAINVDMSSRRAAPFPAHIQPAIDTACARHADIPKPAHIGRHIGIRRG